MQINRQMAAKETWAYELCRQSTVDTLQNLNTDVWMKPTFLVCYNLTNKEPGSAFYCLQHVLIKSSSDLMRTTNYRFDQAFGRSLLLECY